MDVAKYGGTQNGGVNRQALSAEDIAARNHLVQWAHQRNFTATQDAIGNLFVRREGQEPNLDPVMTGSHLDSQPTGGKFDGAYGVLAGLEVLDALNDAGVETRRPVEVVAWTNEEGSRFSPGAMGSSVFTGIRELNSVLDVTDRSGVALRDALAETLGAAEIDERLSQHAAGVHSYVEAHIEQGPVLEDAGLTIGVVTGIQGVRRFEIDISGEEAHAGTTPRGSRKDALAAAIVAIAELEKLTTDDDDVLRFTVGRCEVSPGSPNTVPGHVHFTIDLRHPDEDVLRSLGNRIAKLVKEVTLPCNAITKDISFVSPAIFAPKVVNVVRQSVENLNIPHTSLPSGAGHDAMHMNEICPTGMVFVPCLNGVSHNEAESATPKDLACGARVLADTIATLAQE